MQMQSSFTSSPLNRRSFMKSGLVAGSAAAVGAGLLSKTKQALGDEFFPGGNLDRGDAAILRFVAAAELLETDLWQQYTELGGVPSGTPNAYQNAFMNLDGDGPQYIMSNTLDEMSHAEFLNAYLASKGESPVDLDRFRTLQGSKATGAKNIGRLTNLMHLTVDTSWYIRYRSTTNPDFGATFPQALNIVNRTAIPVTDADFNNPTHIQVIADIAAFHFASIEQGGTSLYASLGRKVTSREVLEITLGIGGSEIAHFLEWMDFAGNAVSGPPITDGGLTFPDFNDPPNPLLQTNLIFPVPCEFINPKLPKCAVIRPLTDRFGGARAAAKGLTASGLFTGQSKEFFATLNELAEQADAARRLF